MTDLPADRMIPILPCRSIDEQLAFYEAIGCSVTIARPAEAVFAVLTPGRPSRHFRPIDQLLVRA